MRNYTRIKNQAYRKYKRIKKVYCPCLKTKVSFNSKGFWHIIYRSRNKKRDVKSQILRFKLLDKAAQLVKLSHTLQEYQEVRRGRKKNIRYYAFIGILDEWKIKVIVKQVGNARPLFWSVIPNWRTGKRDRRRYLYKGNLEAD